MVKRKMSRTAFIRALSAKKLLAEKIAARVKKTCGSEPTVGYVNRIASKK